MKYENEWREDEAREAGLAPLTQKGLQAIISSRVRKELKTVGQFVWATIAYQIILLALIRTHSSAIGARCGSWSSVSRQQRSTFR